MQNMNCFCVRRDLSVFFFQACFPHAPHLEKGIAAPGNRNPARIRTKEALKQHNSVHPCIEMVLECDCRMVRVRSSGRRCELV
jgi:hypothetical protein